MPRPRHQEGWIELYKGPKGQRWVGHWHTYSRDEAGDEVRRHHSKVLGSKDQLTHSEAWAELRKLIAKDGAAGVPKPDDRITFGTFWRDRWMPMREGRWRKTTRETVLYVIEGHIAPVWDDVQLRNIDAVRLTQWLNLIARNDASDSLVRKCRTYMRSILAEAVEQEYLARSPARRLDLPHTRKPASDFLTMPQVRALLGQLEGRDKIIAELFIIGGLRPGECFALRWCDLRPAGIAIEQAVVRGVVGETKTEGSRASVALPASLIDRIRGLATDPALTAHLFASRTGRPINLRNWDRDVLQPAAIAAGKLKVNYQIMRRTFATLAHDLGISMKVVQAQLRHASIETTGDIYTQIVDGAQQAAVERFAEEITKVVK